jgi:hypothetical protein
MDPGPTNDLHLLVISMWFRWSVRSSSSSAKETEQQCSWAGAYDYYGTE